MRRTTFALVLILAAALIPACASNKGPAPASGVNTEESPAASASPDTGNAASPADNGASDNSANDTNATDPPEKDASKDQAKNTGAKQEGPCSVAGRKTRRVVFPKGATEVMTTGSMQGFEDEQVLLIDVRAGQNIRIEDVGDNPVTLVVCDPDGQNVDDYDLSCHGRFKYDNTKKGDYRVFVTECKKADPWKGEYKLKFSAVDAK